MHGSRHQSRTETSRSRRELTPNWPGSGGRAGKIGHVGLADKLTHSLAAGLCPNHTGMDGNSELDVIFDRNVSATCWGIAEFHLRNTRDVYSYGSGDAVN